MIFVLKGVTLRSHPSALAGTGGGDSPKIDPPEDCSVKRMRTSVAGSEVDDGESKTVYLVGTIPEMVKESGNLRL